MWAVITIMPALETDFETARSITSLPFTLNMIGFAVGNLVIGRVIDRFGVIISVIAAAMASAIAYYLASQTQNFQLLTAFHLLLGFGTAAGFGPLISDISHWFLKHRGIAVALIASGNYLAGGLWPLFLSDILLEQGWRDAYQILAALTLIVIIPLLCCCAAACRMPRISKPLPLLRPTVQISTYPHAPFFYYWE